VFGIPSKLVLEPLDDNNPPNVDLTRAFFWRNFFRVRATIKDSNGFIVANFDEDLHFTMLQGTAPTVPDPVIIGAYNIQHMDPIDQGTKDFTFKVDYTVADNNIRNLTSQNRPVFIFFR